MKKKLFSFLIAVFAFVPAMFALTGCGDKPTPPANTRPHTHTVVNHYEEDDGFVYTWSTCKGCDDYSTERVGFTIPNLRVVTTIEEAYNEFNDMAGGKTIFFKEGTYEGILECQDSEMANENIAFLAEDGVYVDQIDLQTHMLGPIESVRVENINFTGVGLTGNNIDISNVTVKNCTFTGTACIGLGNNWITNVVVDSCDFKNIDNDLHQQTAINIQFVDGIEVKDCTFDNVIYNAMQLGEVKGAIKITNNSFKNIHSRTIYFTGDVSGVESCDISGNTFYAKDLTDANAKANGNYFCSNNANELLVVGENYWEAAPANELLYIKNFTYNQAAQKKA